MLPAMEQEALESMPDRHEPTQPEIRTLAKRLGAESFERRARRAAVHAEEIRRVEQLKAEGVSETGAIRRLLPHLSRSGYRRRLRCLRQREGADWERLFDRRAAPVSWMVPDTWRALAIGVRRHSSDASLEAIRDALVAQYGSQASLSDSALRKIFREEGLSSGAARQRAGHPGKDVVELHGGGGLALVLAAAVETGAVAGLAEVTKLETEALEPNPEAVAEPEGRDERGRFTAEYNRNRLADVGPGDPDPRFRSIDEVAAEKDLSRLSICKMKPETLEDRLLVSMVVPAISERRGVVGLDDPAGFWTRAVSPVAYRWRTLDKFSSELKHARMSDPMWDQHLRQWSEWNDKWTEGQGVRRYVAYLDGSQDPWWTRLFARSGKVARVGRVMPCLSRLLLSGGTGVPLLVETYSGQASIRRQLPSILGRADEILGPGKLARLLVVDAELVSVELFEELDRLVIDEQGNRRHFITVLKGAVLDGKTFDWRSEPIPFRERDTLREGIVRLNHPRRGPGAYPIRVVEMVRPDSRHPTPTYFATSAPEEQLPAPVVADVYLQRWPHNEQVFRRGRNGLGMEHSRGFGRKSLHNVALVTERDKAAGQCERARRKQQEALGHSEAVREEIEGAQARLKQLRAKRKGATYLRAADAKIEHQQRHVEALKAEKRAADKQAAVAKRRLAQTEAKLSRLASMPATIAKRDVELDSIGTCLKLSLLALLEFIIREYFGGVRIEPRVFLSAFVSSPVRIETTRTTLRYVIADNPRDPQHTELLCRACEEVTARTLYHRRRRLILEVAAATDGG